MQYWLKLFINTNDNMEKSMKKEFLSYIYIGGLSIIFIAICLMVIISKENTYFIKKKLQVGALLLSLTGAMMGCDNGGVVTCYAPPYEPPASIIENNDCNYSVSYGSIDINLNECSILTGTIRDSNDNNYSFEISNSSSVILEDDIILSEGNNTFEIDIN